MSRSHDLEDRLAHHLHAEAPGRAPDRVLLDALATIDDTRQRHRAVLRSEVTMFSTLRMGAAATFAGLITLMVLVLAPTLRTSPAGPDALASPSGEAVGGSPSPGVPARPTMRIFTLLDTDHWLRWTSPALGYAMRFPPDWNLLSARPGGEEATSDRFLSPDPNLSFSVVAEPLPADETFADWVTEYSAAGVDGNGTYGPPCWGSPETWRSITVSGVEALVHGGPAECYFVEAVAEDAGVVYHFVGTRVDPQRGFDSTLFESFLSTVTLDPASAVLPAASPAS